jgi:hypothetical protein
MAGVSVGAVDGLSTVVALIDGSKGGRDVFADEDELVVDAGVVVELAGDVDVGETVDGDTDVVVDDGADVVGWCAEKVHMVAKHKARIIGFPLSQ